MSSAIRKRVFVLKTLIFHVKVSFRLNRYIPLTQEKYLFTYILTIIHRQEVCVFQEESIGDADTKRLLDKTSPNKTSPYKTSPRQNVS